MADARTAYLESQVMTATPQKLRLMLIDGALRFLNAAHGEMTSTAPDAATVGESLSRARAIVAELLSTIRDDGEEVNKQLIGLYLFVYQSLTVPQLNQQPEKVQDVMSILEVEQETWRQVCEQNPDAPAPDERLQARGREILADAPAIAPTFSNSGGAVTSEAPPSSGFSIDA